MMFWADLTDYVGRRSLSQYGRNWRLDMGTKTITETRCDRQGCKTVVRDDSGIRGMPPGWATVQIYSDIPNTTVPHPDTTLIVCPRCLTVINPPPKRPRSDKGIKRKPAKKEALVGQERASGLKKVESTTMGQNISHKASSKNQKLDCALCPTRVDCKIVGIKERGDCWQGKLEKGELKEVV